MQTYAVTLRPKGSSISPITAQTLFGAVCWAIDTLRLTGNMAQFVADLAQKPQFLFSSAFPFIQGPSGFIRFLPKPILPPVTMPQVQQMAEKRASTGSGTRFKEKVKEILEQQVKPTKNAGYVSEGLFAQVCAGQWSSPALAEALGTTVEQVPPVGLWLKKERYQTWGQTGQPKTAWATVDVQRNAVDRVAGASAEGLLFHESQVFYQPQQTGLWFIVRAEAGVWPWLEAAFRYLADTGLGGKRAVGKGHFDFEKPVPYTLPDVPDADSFITLSPYLPRFEEEKMEAEPRRYTLQIVRQKAENKFPGPGPQQVVYTGGLRLFGEGSVFALAEKRETHYGRIVELGQVSHRQVYYNGLALPVFAKLGGVV
jgi:CRISPR-associated protein Csm4